MSHLEVVATEGAALAAAVARDPAARIAQYPTWSAADLGRHVGAIHRWTTTLVRTASTSRLPKPAVSGVADDDVPAWLAEGCDQLVAALASAPSQQHTWTFVAGRDTAEFWRRRMAVETTLHRWDAQEATGRTDPVPDWLAVEAIDEAVEIYLVPGLAEAAIGTRQQRVVLDCGDVTRSLLLGPQGVEVDMEVEEAGTDPDAVLYGSPLEVWLFLVSRRDLGDLRVEGDHAVAARFATAISQVGGPG